MCKAPPGIMEYGAKVKNREKAGEKIKPKQNETLNSVTMESFETGKQKTKRGAGCHLAHMRK